MKKLTLSILVLFLVLSLLFTGCHSAVPEALQKQSDYLLLTKTEYSALKPTYIKRQTTYKYTADGKPLSEVNRDIEDDYTVVERYYTYDQQGNLTQLDEYFTDRSYHQQNVYTYDSLSRLNTQKHYRDGRLVYETEYHYQLTGWRTIQKFENYTNYSTYSASGQLLTKREEQYDHVFEYTYTSFGEIASTYAYQSGKLLYYSLNSYDSHGNWLSEIIYDSNDQPMLEHSRMMKMTYDPDLDGWIYKEVNLNGRSVGNRSDMYYGYDENNRLIRKIYQNKNTKGELTYYNEVTYHYDDNGNLLQEVELPFSREPQVSVTYKYIPLSEYTP